MSAAFLKALADDFETNGAAAIEKVRTEDPSTYIRVLASLQPKEIELHRPLDDMTDERLVEVIQFVEDALKARLPDSREKDVPTKPTLNRERQLLPMSIDEDATRD
jgi:hypothetical protein